MTKWDSKKYRRSSEEALYGIVWGMLTVLGNLDYGSLDKNLRELVLRCFDALDEVRFEMDMRAWSMEEEYDDTERSS